MVQRSQKTELNFSQLDGSKFSSSKFYQEASSQKDWKGRAMQTNIDTRDNEFQKFIEVYIHKVTVFTQVKWEENKLKNHRNSPDSR